MIYDIISRRCLLGIIILYFTLGITMFEPFKMNENASNLCWYPFYSPTSTDSDLLYSTVIAHQLESPTAEMPNASISLIKSNSQTDRFPFSIIPSTSVSMAEAGTVSRNRKSPVPTTSGNNFVELVTSEQTQTWQRKLSAGGK